VALVLAPNFFEKAGGFRAEYPILACLRRWAWG
jgi:hypothetical protein